MATRNQPEGIEQAKVVAWAQANIARYPALAFLFHTPNGGARNVVVAMQMKALGVRRGVPDLLMPHRQRCESATGQTASYCGIAIEMKAKGGRADPDQVRWRDWLVSQGWCYALCYSSEEAISKIAEYLQGNPTLKARVDGFQAAQASRKRTGRTAH